MNSARRPVETETLLQRESLDPALTRALRGMVAFIAPLVFCQATGFGADAYFAAMGAQVVALTDVRGAYRFRFVILLFVTAVITAATLLGTLAGSRAFAAVLAMGLVALLSGLWRHLSWDYGPGLGISSALLFIVALSQPADHGFGWRHAAFALAGAAWGIGLQAMLWPFRPQHALRHAVAESWVAVSALFEAMRPTPDRAAQEWETAIARRELELRETLDRTYAVLAGAEGARHARLVAHLQELHLAAAQLGTRAVALNASLEGLAARPDFSRLAASLDSLLLALNNLGRSAAITTVTHRPENFAISDVRLRRCSSLARVVAARLNSLGPGAIETAMPREILRQIGEHLAVIENKLRETVDRGAAGPGFPLRLPDLSVLSPRSLSSWMNPSAHLDPVLVRHTLRMTALTMLGIAIYKGFDIPRGYWIAFSIIVVLQPDYGSTRKRAGQRILGTFAGSLAASALIWVHLPLPWLDALIAAMVFGFAYHQKQRYGLAVFFITVMLVLLTETAATVHLDFTVTRLLCTLGGGALALVGALFFWPTWERERFPVTMAAAIRANRVYLEKLAELLFDGAAFQGKAVQLKRDAETANSAAAASLQRMLGDPAGRQSNIEAAAALVHSNTRVTRALAVLRTNLQAGQVLGSDPLKLAACKTGEVLEAMASLVETDPETQADVHARLVELESLESVAENQREQLVRLQLEKIATEVSAMLLALNPPAKTANSPDKRGIGQSLPAASKR